jgi:hypothetical protein
MTLLQQGTNTFFYDTKYCTPLVENSVAEPQHFYAAPGKNFDATPAIAAPAPTLLIQ